MIARVIWVSTIAYVWFKLLGALADLLAGV
jgi:hypothetical protein